MTPTFWHNVATVLRPYKRYLALAVAVGLVSTGIAFSFRQSLVLPLSVLSTLWLAGLLQITFQFSVVPAESSGGLGKFSLYWDGAVRWDASVFMTVWFLLLTGATVAAPFLYFK